MQNKTVSFSQILWGTSGRQTQQTNTCSIKSTTETPKKGVKYVQS